MSIIQTQTSPFQQAIDVVEALPHEDQQTLVELVQHRLALWRRSEIARNTASTLESVRSGQAQIGSLEDLKHVLLDD